MNSSYYRKLICYNNEDKFVFTVDTTKTGTGSTTNTQFKLPLVSGSTYDFTVEWGDSSIQRIIAWNQAETTHTYSESGVYTIKLIGRVDRFAFDNAGDRLKFKDLEQWGNIQWKSMESMFYGCTNMTGSFTDSPDLSQCSILEEMFKNCSNFNTSLANWNTSTITSTKSMFSGASKFNQDLHTKVVNEGEDNEYIAWDTSSLTTAQLMFENAIVFNGNITNWDISNINGTGLNSIFYGAAKFNQDVDTKSVTVGYNTYTAWDTTGITSTSQIFYGCTAFNQSINNWNMSLVTTANSMFSGCIAFNQDLSGWTTTNLASMLTMFYNCTLFNNGGQSLNTWDVSKVTNMTGTFYLCPAFNADITGWTTSLVNITRNMFNGCTIFNQDISGWSMGLVTDASLMFYGCAAFNQNIGIWDMGSCLTTANMFYGCTLFNQNLSNWDVTVLANSDAMFFNASAFNQNLGNWEVSSLTSAASMFNGSALSKTNYDNLLVGWTGWSGGAPAKPLQSNVVFSVGTTKYTAGGDAEAARTYLDTTLNWTITDGGV